MNIVGLTGRLTYEPELKVTQNGTSIIRFQVACDRAYQSKNSSQQGRQADFIDCVAWRQTAEFISKYFHKGAMIAVEGNIQTNIYTDKNGNKRKDTSVLVTSVSFCAPKSDNGSQSVGEIEQHANDDIEEIIDDDEDLPF